MGRTASTRALEAGLSQVRMKSKHWGSKTLTMYDQGREKLEPNAVNFLRYEEEG